MERIIKSITLVSLFILLIPGGAALAQNKAGETFERALYIEESEGDLQKAIDMYKTIIQLHGGERSIAARAQLHIGLCYEKLGQNEARAAYQKVIDNYPQQHQEVASARERMARLGEDAFSPTFRQIHHANKIPWDAQLSPDGRSIAFVNNDWLWIAPTSSDVGPDYLGIPKQLDTQGVKVDWPGFTWSKDGQWIAFNGKEVKEGRQKIYVAPAAGGKLREIYENNRDARVVNYRMSLSPHGKTIAFTCIDENIQHIYKKPVDGGPMERLVDVPAREPVFSPDGKMLAYVEDKLLGRDGGGLWVVPVEGGNPTRVADAGNASSPIWSPDGKMLAFRDDSANKKIYIVRLGADGRTIGEKISIDCPESVDEVVRLTGWTPDNKIGAVVKIPTEFALYTQPVDGGTATFVTHGGYPMQPRWSPDGKMIYHVNNADESSGDWAGIAIAYVPAEGGKVTTVPLHSDPKIRFQEAFGIGDLLSPDGKTLVFAGYKSGDPVTVIHIWTLPVDGGTPTQLTGGSFMDLYPSWSPDGKEIAFMQIDTPAENWAVLGKANIYIIPATGGEPRQITSEPDRVFGYGPVRWSPDGKLLAYFARQEDSVDGNIYIISTNGGEPKAVAKVQWIWANKEMAWSPDSRRIAYNAWKPESINSIKIVSLKDGSIEEIEPNLKGVSEIYHLDWSPDGKNLVFGGYTGGGSELMIMEDFLPLVKQ